VARIEVHAASQAQLDEMLLSLNQALARFQKGPVYSPSEPGQLVPHR
jgi:hypothetical protein